MAASSAQPATSSDEVDQQSFLASEIDPSAETSSEPVDLDPLSSATLVTMAPPPEPAALTSTMTSHPNLVTDEELGKNLTLQLAGSMFVHGLRVKFEGRNRLLFAFTDLSSRLEGVFVLRYRCFNVLETVIGPFPRPVMACCVGGEFQVYSTKTFPGLRKPTPLTKVIYVQDKIDNDNCCLLCMLYRH
jgi:hypothetical protein